MHRREEGYRFGMGVLLQQILFLVLLQCCMVVRSRPQGEELKAPLSNERSQLKEVGRFRKSVDTSGECRLQMVDFQKKNWQFLSQF